MTTPGGGYPGGLWDPLNWFSDAGAAAQNWLGSIGGSLASGIEGGFVAILKDLWKVIEGPLLVVIGIAIAAIVLVVYFKNDIMAVAGSAAAAA
jgi:hypothetical protein